MTESWVTFGHQSRIHSTPTGWVMNLQTYKLGPWATSGSWGRRVIIVVTWLWLTQFIHAESKYDPPFHFSVPHQALIHDSILGHQDCSIIFCLDVTCAKMTFQTRQRTLFRSIHTCSSRIAYPIAHRTPPCGSTGSVSNGPNFQPGSKFRSVLLSVEMILDPKHVWMINSYVLIKNMHLFFQSHLYLCTYDPKTTFTAFGAPKNNLIRW